MLLCLINGILTISASILGFLSLINTNKFHLDFVGSGSLPDSRAHLTLMPAQHKGRIFSPNPRTIPPKCIYGHKSIKSDANTPTRDKFPIRRMTASRKFVCLQLCVVSHAIILIEAKGFSVAVIGSINFPGTSTAATHPPKIMRLAGAVYELL